MNPDHLHTNIKNTKKLLIRSLAPCVYLLVHSAVFLSAAAEILRQKEVRSEQPVAFHLPVISDPDVTSASTNNQIFASSPAAGISCACFNFFQAPLLQRLQCRTGSTRRSYNCTSYGHTVKKEGSEIKCCSGSSAASSYLNIHKSQIQQ